MAIRKEKRKFKFHGDGGALFGIHISNLFLALITLGIYSFWGRVNIRKYLWGQMEFEKDRLSYHGTGEETLRGWVRALLIFGIPYFLFRDGPRLMHLGTGVIVIGALFSFMLIILFFPMAVVGSRRYRLSRTAWRGIRFSFRRSWKEYLPFSWKGNLKIAATLGIYGPYYDMEREGFLLDNTYVGNRHFGFDGKGKDLIGPYLTSLFLGIPTLGLSLFYYHYYRHRYVWNQTTFGKARFNCTITFGGLLRVESGNLLMVLFTLGFAYSWAQVRSIKYLMENLTLVGKADLRNLKQQAKRVNATGEELASFFDLDFDLG